MADIAIKDILFQFVEVHVSSIVRQRVLFVACDSA